MRTKHLNQLLADVAVAKFHFAIIFKSNGNSSVSEGLALAAWLSEFESKLSQAVHIRNRSYLLDLDSTYVLCRILNNRGFNFKIPEGDSIKLIVEQLKSGDFESNAASAASFAYCMLSHNTSLNPAELAAVQACLNVIEDRIET